MTSWWGHILLLFVPCAQAGHDENSFVQLVQLLSKVLMHWNISKPLVLHCRYGENRLYGAQGEVLYGNWLWFLSEQMSWFGFLDFSAVKFEDEFGFFFLQKNFSEFKFVLEVRSSYSSLNAVRYSSTVEFSQKSRLSSLAASTSEPTNATMFNLHLCALFPWKVEKVNLKSSHAVRLAEATKLRSNSQAIFVFEYSSVWLRIPFKGCWKNWNLNFLCRERLRLLSRNRKRTTMIEAREKRNQEMQ